MRNTLLVGIEIVKSFLECLHLLTQTFLSGIHPNKHRSKYTEIVITGFFVNIKNLNVYKWDQ